MRKDEGLEWLSTACIQNKSGDDVIAYDIVSVITTIIIDPLDGAFNDGGSWGEMSVIITISIALLRHERRHQSCLVW